MTLEFLDCKRDANKKLTACRMGGLCSWNKTAAGEGALHEVRLNAVQPHSLSP